MLYLIIAILFGSLFAVVFKVCQQRQIDTGKVIMYNYLTGFIISLFSVDWSTLDTLPCGEGWGEASLFITTLLQGALFMTGFIVMDRSTWRNGVALTNVSARASLILPVILSWLLLDQPSPEWLQVCLVLAAMLMIILPNQNQQHDSSLNRSRSDAERKRKAAIALVGVFLFYGVSDFSLKVVEHTASKTSIDFSLVMTIIFFSAFVFSTIRVLLQNHKIPKSPNPQITKSPTHGCKAAIKSPTHGCKAAIIAGLCLGLVNTCCTTGMLYALREIPTSIYYPLYNIGIVILSTIIGICFFKEHIKWLQIAGLVLAVVAISLTLI